MRILDVKMQTKKKPFFFQGNRSTAESEAIVRTWFSGAVNLFFLILKRSDVVMFFSLYSCSCFPKPNHPYWIPCHMADSFARFHWVLSSFSLVNSSICCRSTSLWMLWFSLGNMMPKWYYGVHFWSQWSLQELPDVGASFVDWNLMFYYKTV